MTAPGPWYAEILGLALVALLLVVTTLAWSAFERRLAVRYGRRHGCAPHGHACPSGERLPATCPLCGCGT